MKNLHDGINKLWECNNPLLSIIILTLPKRAARLNRLILILTMQKDPRVELIVNMDNKQFTVGEKRQQGLDAATGEYVTFIDDDDTVSVDYLKHILQATQTKKDVIVFRQQCVFGKGNPFIVTPSINNPVNEDTKQIGGVWVDVKRKPFHFCVWKAEIAHKHRFPYNNYGEDWAWCKSMLENDVRTEHRINHVLHYYTWDKDVTECPGP